MAIVLSEPPEKPSVWGNYYAERGLTRPPQGDGTRSDKPPEEPTAGENKPPGELSPELAAAIEAVTSAVPESTAVPFLTAMQKQAVARELKRRSRLRLVRISAVALVGLIVVPVLGTLLFNRAPAEPALAEHVEQIAAGALAQYSRADQSLTVGETKLQGPVPAGFGRLRYEVVVTLRLRVPLYVPAQTNGTEAYRMLQLSLAEAVGRVAKLRLFRPPTPPPPRPDMPMLVQMSHRGNEPLVVTLAFEARRFGWRWRLGAAEPVGSPSRTFTGQPLDRYAGTRVLVFGSPDSVAEVRGLVKQARDYVTAVNKEARERAVFDAPAVDSALAAPNPNVAAVPEPEFSPAALDPNAPAVAQPKPSAPIDPNAPAVTQPKATPVMPDPNAPAVAPITVPGLDPNAPAVRKPK